MSASTQLFGHLMLMLTKTRATKLLDNEFKSIEWWTAHRVRKFQLRKQYREKGSFLL